jgi:FkbM family methyltransferase
MKSVVRKYLRRLGIKVSKFQTSPYESFLELPRYQKKEFDLFGKPFTVPDTYSFYFSFREIFIEEIYRFKTTQKKPFIIDCGSNYGLSIIFYQMLYPEARIIGVEADPEIFNILQSNLQAWNIQDIKLYQKAISAQDSSITFYREGADAGSIKRNDASQKVEVETLRLDDLISEEVDFLKIDIEGAETEVISSCKRLGMVKNLFIEFHAFKKEPQALSRILAKLEHEGFRYYIKTQFCSENPFVKKTDYLGMDLLLNIFAIRGTKIKQLK